MYASTRGSVCIRHGGAGWNKLDQVAGRVLEQDLPSHLADDNVVGGTANPPCGVGLPRWPGRPRH